jgi:hypothetical protein
LILASAPAGASVTTGGGDTHTLTEVATVSLAVARQETGRRVGGKCVKATRKNRGKKRCKRFITAGGLPSVPHIHR